MGPYAPRPFPFAGAYVRALTAAAMIQAALSRSILALLAAAAAALAPAPAAWAAPLPREIACVAGAYVMPDGGHLIVTGQEKGQLGYLLPDGERGLLRPGRPGEFTETPPRPALSLAFSGCGPVVRVAIGDGPARPATRVVFRETPLSVHAGDLTLSGKLVAPGRGRIRKAAIFVDGSDQTGAVDRTYWQYALPLRGIGVFVLDKRGTGGSGGAPTADFHLRAADVVAAQRVVRRHAGPGVDVGLLGVSQGGWVAPLAATAEPSGFVVVAYGLAEGVTAEDRDEIVQDLQAAGFGAAEIAEALELQAAAAAVARSRWTQGWEALDALKAKYAKAPWIGALSNEGFTGLLVKMPSELARRIAPKADLGVSFDYEPRPVIAALRTRQLWVLGGDDHSAPSARTLEILRELQAENPKLTVAVFPRAEHGIVERTETGAVSHVRLSAGYLDLVARWIDSGRTPRVSGAVVHAPGRKRDR